MVNIKASSIIAGVAFVLSFIIGLISGNSFLVVLGRGFIFAIVFFGLSSLGFLLMSRFLPELLAEGDDSFDLPVPGSRVDISVDAPITGAFPSDSSDKVDDIGRRPSAWLSGKDADTPLDQDDNTGYNGGRGFSGDIGLPGGGDGDDSGDIGVLGNGNDGQLPDMEHFSEEDAIGSMEEVELEPFSSEPQRSSSSKKPPVGGDFPPKDLAQAIQTVLKRDDKG